MKVVCGRSATSVASFDVDLYPFCAEVCHIHFHHPVVVYHVVTCVFAALNRFSGEPQSESVVEGGLARLECHIEGFPAPSIAWELNRQPLPQDQRYCFSSVILARSVRK